MPRKGLTRHERRALARATVNGFVAGVTRAVVDWLLSQI